MMVNFDRIKRFAEKHPIITGAIAVGSQVYHARKVKTGRFGTKITGSNWLESNLLSYAEKYGRIIGKDIELRFFDGDGFCYRDTRAFTVPVTNGSEGLFVYVNGRLIDALDVLSDNDSEMAEMAGEAFLGHEIGHHQREINASGIRERLKYALGIAAHSVDIQSLDDLEVYSGWGRKLAEKCLEERSYVSQIEGQATMLPLATMSSEGKKPKRVLRSLLELARIQSESDGYRTDENDLDYMAGSYLSHGAKKEILENYWRGYCED